MYGQGKSNLIDSVYLYCWPFLSNCNSIKFIWTNWSYNLIVFIWLLLTLLTLYLFLKNKYIKWAYLTFALINIIKFVILIQDYRFMGNYHYMPFILSAAYLFIPDKLFVASIFITLFYYFAGTLKLNSQWLSGQTMLAPSWIPMGYFKWLCFYVVVLEMIFIWGLYSTKKIVRYLVYLQFFIFHIISWYWVGHFYPTVMFCLIGVFYLFWSENQNISLENILMRMGKSKVIFFTFVVFIIFQLIPYIYKEDVAVTGRGRIFSLNMYDATTKCVDLVYIASSDSTVEVSSHISESFAQRVHCDPILYFNELKMICDELNLKRMEHAKVDFHLLTRRTSDSYYTSVVSKADICENKLKYNLFGKNNWIDEN